jgi:hypothetical protein
MGGIDDNGGSDVSRPRHHASVRGSRRLRSHRAKSPSWSRSWGSLGGRPVAAHQFVVQHSVRPAVEDQVVDEQGQHVLTRTQAQQQPVPQRRGIERARAFGLRDDPLAGGCRRVRAVRQVDGRDVDVDPGAHHLVDVVAPRAERRAQRIVPQHEGLERPGQRARVELSVQVPRDGGTAEGTRVPAGQEPVTLVVGRRRPHGAGQGRGYHVSSGFRATLASSAQN